MKIYLNYFVYHPDPTASFSWLDRTTEYKHQRRSYRSARLQVFQTKIRFRNIYTKKKKKTYNMKNKWKWSCFGLYLWEAREEEVLHVESPLISMVSWREVTDSPSSYCPILKAVICSNFLMLMDRGFRFFSLKVCKIISMFTNADASFLLKIPYNWITIIQSVDWAFTWVLVLKRDSQSKLIRLKIKKMRSLPLKINSNHFRIMGSYFKIKNWGNIWADIFP